MRLREVPLQVRGPRLEDLELVDVRDRWGLLRLDRKVLRPMTRLSIHGHSNGSAEIAFMPQLET